MNSQDGAGVCQKQRQFKYNVQDILQIFTAGLKFV